jgi:hypothetical protein
MSLSRVDRVVEDLQREVLAITQKPFPPGMTDRDVAAARDREYQKAFERSQALMARFSPEEIRELADRLDDIAARLRMQADGGGGDN